ncbi:MAG: acyl-CoA dehydrogenase family protein [Nitrosomonas sp.]
MHSFNRKLNPPEIARSLAIQVNTFVDQLIIPNEPLLAQEGDLSLRLQFDLANKARLVGLYGLYYPLSQGGKITSLEDYLVVAEQAGRTEFAQTIFGNHMALDAHMLVKYGNDPVCQQFLQPMINGNAIPGYSITEPGQNGSIPSLIKASARLSNGKWHINGRKWFVSNTDRATFMTILVRTAGEDVPIDKALSMIIVPTNTPGFKIERQLTVMGHSSSQGEISLNEVQVPEQNLLGTCGSGIQLVKNRLNLDRLLSAMNWIGLAQRCLDLMTAQTNSLSDTANRLASKQRIHRHILNAYQEILSARELIRIAAKSIDAQNPNTIAINVAKMAASRALCIASDSVMQLYDSEGFSDESLLFRIDRIARTSRILDDNDETLMSSIERRTINVIYNEAPFL